MKNLKFTLVHRLLFNVFIISAVSFVFYSCSDSDSSSPAPVASPYKCVSCKAQSDAKAENDNSYKGVYMAVTSRGNITVDLQNSSEKLLSRMTIDGVNVDLVAKNVLLDKNNYTTVFTGIYKGTKISFDFSVKGDGSQPIISSDLFPEVSKINKEKSNTLIEVFEGVYRAKDPSSVILENKIIDTLGTGTGTTYITGKYNMLVYRSTNVDYKSGVNPNGSWWKGVIELDGKTYQHIGTINDNSQLVDENNNFVGKLTVDEINGYIFNKTVKGAYLNSKRVF